MRPTYFLSVCSCLVFVLLSFTCSTALGEGEFPKRHLTYRVFFEPGGQSDREARRQQPYLKMSLGQAVMIEYKIGGDGAAGWREFSKKTRPDGYTMAGFNLPHIILQPLLGKPGYHTSDMEPVMIFERTPLGLAVLADSPYKTLIELLEACKEEPGKIKIGGSSINSASYFAALRLERLAGTKFNYVPMTGTGPPMDPLKEGLIDAWFANSEDLVEFRDKLRILAFSVEDRFGSFPDTPTFRELGFDLVASIDRGVCVPVKTPEEIVRKLEKVYLEISNTPSVRDGIVKAGSIPVAIGSDEARAYIGSLGKSYTELIQELK